MNTDQVYHRINKYRENILRYLDNLSNLDVQFIISIKVNDILLGKCLVFFEESITFK